MHLGGRLPPGPTGPAQPGAAEPGRASRNIPLLTIGWAAPGQPGPGSARGQGKEGRAREAGKGGKGVAMTCPAQGYKRRPPRATRRAGFSLHSYPRRGLIWY